MAFFRFGQHMFAVPAISRLINNISSESFHFWLSCLRDVSMAECALMNEKPLPEGMTEKSAASKTTVIENISIASVHYSKAIAAIKVMDVHIKIVGVLKKYFFQAAGSVHTSLQFASEYLRLRLNMLQCMSQLVQACNSLYQPPPAIAMNQAQMCNDEFLRHGRTTIQLRKCAAEFRNIADNYLKLAQSAFDADPKTLANVRMYPFLLLKF